MDKLDAHTKFGLNTPKLQYVVEARRVFSVKFVLAVLAFIVFIYIFFWHALQNDVLAVCCIVTCIASLFLYWRVTKGMDSLVAANGVLILSTAIVYLTGIYTWKDSPAGVAFFPAISAGVMIFWGRRKAIAWTTLCTAMVVSLPWVSQIAAPMPDFAEVRTFFNVFYSSSALIVVCTIVYLSEDISMTMVNELISMKDKLEQTQEDLIKVQRYRNRFFASISHEIRTPMNAVRGISEILTQNHNLTDEDAHLVNTLHRSSSHLLSIINDLLDVSKLEEDKLRFIDVDFELRDVIYDANTIVRYAAVEKNLSLKTNIDQALPKFIHADPNRLRQVLVNILNNAVKFTDQGQVALSCTLKPSPAGASNVLHIKVSDTGIGIAKDAQSDIFNGYVQADDHISTKFGGTGLGLNICKRIVELQGGQIWLDSVLGEGTTFYIDFPFKPALGAPQLTQENDTLNEPSIDWPCSVLLVDDNKINVLVAQKQLSMRMPQGNFVSAENGQLAIDMLEAGLRPDIILMDIHMPVLGGIEATKQLRAHSHADIARIPIIAMTANTSEEDVHACYSAGMNDFISKPFDVQVLLLKIATLSPPPKSA